MTTTPSARAREAARALTEARKIMVLSLPADGSWGTVPNRSVAKRAWWSMVPPIVVHKHRPEDQNEWALTPYGQEIATAIRKNKP